MIAKFYCALALLLSGCAATQSPQIVYKPVEVQVPVAVPCKIQAPDVPKWALDSVSPGADVYVKGRALVAELQQRIAYEKELLAAVASCQ
jgi:PBP1b-binding outer membrane lipoprotein LpoB